MRILIVEDETTLRELLVTRFTNDGFAVDAAADGEEGLYFGCEYTPDIAVIDLGLPRMSGMELIGQLRAHKANFPILILTARGDWQDKVAGLEAGADDYLVKPFHVEELLARVNALIRRSAGWSQSTLECGPITLNTSSQVVSVDGNEIELTSYEYKILEYLFLHSGEVISKSILTDHIYQQDFERDSNVIEVFVGRLRKKLDPKNSIKPIETLRGRGYRVTLERNS